MLLEEVVVLALFFQWPVEGGYFHRQNSGYYWLRAYVVEGVVLAHALAEVEEQVGEHLNLQ